MEKNKKTNGKDPAVLLYTQDFIVGTMTMTNEERGKYILLLCMQHQKGKLTLKDLASVITEEDIELAEKFPLHTDGFYYNDRMEMEIQNRKIRTDSSRNNGARGGRPIKTTILPNDEPNTNPNETHRLLVGKPNNNPTGNENGNEVEDINVYETEIENESGNEVGVGVGTPTMSNYRLYYKLYKQLINFETDDKEYEAIYFDIQDDIGWDNFYSVLKLSQKELDNLDKVITIKLK